MEADREADWTQTPLAKQIGLRYPIIQGPLGGLATEPLTALVSEFGGLGSYGAHGLKPEAIAKVIAEIRARTARPFAINLWVSMEDEGAFTANAEAFARARRPLETALRGLGEELPEFRPYAPTKFTDQVRVAIDARVPALSFIFGIPPREILDECRRQKIVTIGGATTVDEALAFEQAGVDAVVASGFEGGGHRGSFLRPGEESLIGTFSLVPQIVDRVRVPVIASGGVADARGMVAALALGAQGVQIGTAFLGTAESGAHPLHRKWILEGKASLTALTKGYTGRLARGIRNEILEKLNEPATEILPYPLQRTLVRHLTAAAEKAGRPELMQLWAGQSAGLAKYADPKEFLEELVAEVSGIAGPIRAWAEKRAGASP